ncbi:GmrSD restriction endonuclease domain-containing protein [Reyranella sp.]|uniref:GmrSD restriction endonuclease domain-containing protein n=1 Tax=Reyranella sp. TaxID=1929291 RepID=UPI003D0BCF6F
MKTQALAASARPDIISLDVLLNDVDEGRVKIPRFQRPYVWTPQMMRELFESVLSGYPIGSLLLWTPQEELNVRTMDRIGPIQSFKSSSKSQISLVLDGHQRLATLYGVLRLPEDHPRDENASADTLSWWLGYDLKAEEPRQLRRAEDFRDPSILPLRSVLKTAEFVRFARAIDSSPSLSRAMKSRYLDRADEVQRALRDYRIALTIMRGGSVDDAVAIFSRINRSGRRMTSDQMAVALTYHDGFNLEEALDEILGALTPFGFGDVSRTILLQSLLHNAGQNFTKPKFDDLRKKETQERLQEAKEPTLSALSSASSFLNQKIGFKTGRLLPYALQLFLLGVFFHKNPVSVEALRRRTVDALSRWFWATSFSGWFASANSAEIERAVEVMERFAGAPTSAVNIAAFDAFFSDRPLRPFPKTFDRRSARIRALLLVQIVREQLLDPVTNLPVDGSALLADPDRRDIPHVFASDGTRPARRPGNRILLDKKYGSVVRSILAENIEHHDALRTHGIGRAARIALGERDMEGFVNAREERMQRQEEEFLAKFGLHIGEQIEPSDAEVDVDED